MGITLLDLHVKNLLDYGFEELRKNPDVFLADIFGDACIEPHAALFGKRLIDQAKAFLKKTEVPVVLGFDLREAQLPAITVHLGNSNPEQSYIGDMGLVKDESIGFQQKEVLVKGFIPAAAAYTDDQLSIQFTLPDDMTEKEKEYFLSGLIIRDKNRKEYDLLVDEFCQYFIVKRNSNAPLSDIDLTKLEVISPVIEEHVREGAMQYDDTAIIAIHGHGSRNEGLFVYYMTMWMLLKYRPLLESTFGLQLSLPSASDYTKDDSYLDEHVWRRFITMKSKSIYSWELTRSRDIVGFLYSIGNIQASSNSGE